MILSIHESACLENDVSLVLCCLYCSRLYTASAARVPSECRASAHMQSRDARSSSLSSHYTDCCRRRRPSSEIDPTAVNWFYGRRRRPVDGAVATRILSLDQPPSRRCSAAAAIDALAAAAGVCHLHLVTCPVHRALLLRPLPRCSCSCALIAYI